MQLSIEQIDALQDLGSELENAGWEPRIPLAEGFETGSADPNKNRVRIALVYLREIHTRIHPVICDGTQCRQEIQSSADVIATIADSIQALGGFPVPTYTIAKTIVMYGAARYCKLIPQ